MTSKQQLDDDEIMTLHSFFNQLSERRTEKMNQLFSIALLLPVLFKFVKTKEKKNKRTGMMKMEMGRVTDECVCVFARVFIRRQ